MDEKATPRPVLAATWLWLAVCLTATTWLRGAKDVPWWAWLVVLALFVPGIVVLVRYERRRRGKLPEPDAAALRPRSFGELPSIQKTRLVVMTVSSALLVLMIGALEIGSVVLGRAGTGDLPFLLIPLLAVAFTVWLWWRLLRRPTRRMAQQEAQLRKAHPAGIYVAWFGIIPAGWLGQLAFHAGGSELLKLTYAFLVNAACAALLLAIGEKLRRTSTAEQDRAATPVW